MRLAFFSQKMCIFDVLKMSKLYRSFYIAVPWIPWQTHCPWRTITLNYNLYYNKDVLGAPFLKCVEVPLKVGLIFLTLGLQNCRKGFIYLLWLFFFFTIFVVFIIVFFFFTICIAIFHVLSDLYSQRIIRGELSPCFNISFVCNIVKFITSVSVWCDLLPWKLSPQNTISWPLHVLLVEKYFGAPSRYQAVRDWFLLKSRVLSVRFKRWD